jgi:hypothetical protein
MTAEIIVIVEQDSRAGISCEKCAARHDAAPTTTGSTVSPDPHLASECH